MFLLADFNIDLMHYNEYKPTIEFLDSLASNSYLQYITNTFADPPCKGTGQVLTRKILYWTTLI